MNTPKTTVGLIVGILALTSIVGFLLTYGNSPAGSYARIMLDVVAAVGCAWLAFKIVQPTEELHTDLIVDGLRDLARGKYYRRLNEVQNDELAEIVQAFNELAGTLADKNEVIASHESKNEPEVNFAQVEPFSLNHSYHPEIGEVRALLQEEVARSAEKLLSDIPQPIAQIELEQKEDTVFEQPTEDTITRLYESFIAAQREFDGKPVSFEKFKETIEATSMKLMEAHKCKDVFFDVVVEDTVVALRPRLVR